MNRIERLNAIAAELQELSDEAEPHSETAADLQTAYAAVCTVIGREGTS